MKITIKTDKLKEMVTRIVKGCSNNKMFPLTSLVGIEVSNNVLTLTSTDMTNYMYISEKGVEGDNFYVSVQADIFAKLVANTTSDTITLDAKDSYLEVVGNGTYKLNLVLDENGEIVKFPNYSDPVSDDTIGNVNFTTVKVILNSLKPALATTVETPCYTNYFVGNTVVATDTLVINAMKTKLFANTEDPIFISGELMDLLNSVVDENIEVRYANNTIQFITSDCVIYGKLYSYTDQFQIDDIMAFVETEFNSMCKVNKAAFIQLIDRIALFIGDYSDGAVTLTFTKDGITVSSKSQAGTEIIPYTDSKNFTDYVCDVELNVLKTQVKAQASDMLEIWYGEDSAIKLVDGNVTSIVGLLADEE